jgi:hypothetical protein
MEADSWSRNPSHFMNSKYSIMLSKEPTTFPYPEINQSSPVPPSKSHIKWKILGIVFVCFAQLGGILTKDMLTVIRLENMGFVKIVLVWGCSCCFAPFS